MKAIIPLMKEVIHHARSYALIEPYSALAETIREYDAAVAENADARAERVVAAKYSCSHCGKKFLGADGYTYCSLGCLFGDGP